MMNSPPPPSDMCTICGRPRVACRADGDDTWSTVAGPHGDDILHDRIHPTSGPLIAAMPLPDTSKRGDQ